MDKQPLIRPETGDVHFLAYIGTLCTSLIGAWLLGWPNLVGPMQFATMMFAKWPSLLLSFLCAAFGLWIARVVLPEWHQRRPFTGAGVAMTASFAATLLVALCLYFLR
jgi:hypothetical protein